MHHDEDGRSLVHLPPRDIGVTIDLNQLGVAFLLREAFLAIDRGDLREHEATVDEVQVE